MWYEDDDDSNTNKGDDDNDGNNDENDDDEDGRWRSYTIALAQRMMQRNAFDWIRMGMFEVSL